MKKFKTKIHFNREKESNWDIEKKAIKKGFADPHNVLYLGYEVEMQVIVSEDGKHKALKINGVDVSDKEIYI